MRAMLAIFKRELALSLGGPRLGLMLLVFNLGLSLRFFRSPGFFERGLADLAPLFVELPWWLLLLSSALAMRFWAEDIQNQNLELQLSLPVSMPMQALGRMLAALWVVALALGLTLSLPLSIAKLGPLDWGPVWAGYGAALALSSAYLGIGMGMSALTGHPLTALLLTLAIGAVLNLAHLPWIQLEASNPWGAILAEFSLTERFESIARGVLDLRDLVYFASLGLLGFGLGLWALKRHVPGHQARFSGIWLLLIVNLGLLNLWMRPLGQLRWDLSADQRQSLGPSFERQIRPTLQALSDAEGPLRITAWVSRAQHPRLASEASELCEATEELARRLRGQLWARCERPGPDQSPPAGLEPYAFWENGQIHSASFGLLLQAGRQKRWLSLQALVEAQPRIQGDAELRLRPLGAVLQKSMKALLVDGQRLARALQADPEALRLRLELPQSEVQNALLGASSEGAESKLKAAIQQLSLPLGFSVVQSQEASKDEARLWIEGPKGQASLLLSPSTDLSELSQALQDAIQKQFFEAERSLGLVQSQPGYRQLKARLASSLHLDAVKTPSGRQHEAWLLLLNGPLSAELRDMLDAEIRRGAKLVILGGRYYLPPGLKGAISLKSLPKADLDWLSSLGFELSQGLVMDTRSGSLVLATKPNPGELEGTPNARPKRLKRLAYPYFLDLREAELGALQGPRSAILSWASALQKTDPKAQTKLHSRDTSWMGPADWLMPNFEESPESGFAPPIPPFGAQILALQQRPPGASQSRGSVLLLGSSSFVSDTLLGALPEALEANLFLAEALIQRMLFPADTVVAESSFDRRLVPLSPAEKARLAWMNHIAQIAGVLLLSLWALFLSRKPRPMRLLPPEEDA